MQKQIADLLAKGFTYSQIAEETGRSYSCISKLARKQGITISRKKVTDEVLKELQLMKSSGMSISEIAKGTGLSCSCVYRYLKEPKKTVEMKEPEVDVLKDCILAVERPLVTKVVEKGKPYTDLFQMIAGG